MNARIEDPPVNNKMKYLIPYQSSFGIGNANSTYTAGRVHLELFAVTVPTKVDAVSVENGGVASGNVTVGIYGPLTTDNPDGAALVGSSASTAMSGTASPQIYSLSSQIELSPGLYYVAIELSSATAQVGRAQNTNYVDGWQRYFDQTYGDLPATVPTTSAASGNNFPFAVIRCQL